MAGKDESLLKTVPDTGGDEPVAVEESVRDAAADGLAADAEPAEGKKTPPDVSSKPSTPADSDKPLTADSPLPDWKAKFAELEKTNDVAELAKFATTVPSRALAGEALEAIIAIDPPNCLDVLKDIAKSNSYGAGAALHHVYVLDEDSRDFVRDRVTSDEFFKMWQEGKIDAREVLLAAFQDAGTVADRAFKELADHPQALTDLCVVLVRRDPIFGGWDIGAVSEETRAKALKQVIADKPENLGRLLLTLARTADSPELVAEAKKALEQLWTSEKPAEAGLGKNSLLIGDRLQKISADLAQVRWGDATDSARMQKEYRRAFSAFEPERHDFQHEISHYLDRHLDIEDRGDRGFEDWHNDKKMAEALKDAPALLKQYQELRAEESKLTEMREKLDVVVRERTAALQVQLDKACDRLGLPRSTIEVVESLGDALGRYKMGRGKVLVLEDTILNFDRPTAEYANTIAHELAHHEQDNLLVRRMADELKVGETMTPEQRDELKAKYKKEVGYELKDTFLDAVIEKRKGETLNQTDTTRAEQLKLSYYDLATSGARRKANERALERVERALQSIDSPVALHFGSGTAEEQKERIKEVLGVKELPPDLDKSVDRVTAAMETLSADLDIAGTEFTRLYEPALRERRSDLHSESSREYQARLHEVESHEVGQRADHFSQEAGLPRQERITDGLLGDLFKSEPAPEGPDKSPPIEKVKAAPDERKPAEKVADLLFEKLGARLKAKLPGEFNADVREILEQILDAQRNNLPADVKAELDKLLTDYGNQDAKAVERVNEMLAAGKRSSESAAARTTPAAPALADGGERGTEIGRQQYTPELAAKPESAQQAIQTFTTADGIKYLKSIPISELTVARVHEKMNEIDDKIREAREAGLHEMAEELKQMKKDYDSKKTPAERDAFARETIDRLTEMHKTASGEHPSAGGKIAGKAGTVVAVMLVAGWLLDVTAPRAVAGPSGPRVLPGKR